ncbi:hypothetical protein DH2020_014380 [Rehmannia glutinosa]|uniref:protein-tyrosine-phosphatase n=1 Tax=Rehmannia glutinosa TaxID=99300 RepID=A0ABR0WWZ0_REHGL
MNVYIWDMDETLILLKSLLNGTYAGAFNGLKNVENGVKIGKLWENHILQIENFNQPYLDVLNQYDDGLDLSDYNFSQDGFGLPLDALNKRKLAYRHRVIAQKYRKGLYNILNQDLIKLWDSLYDLTDTYTEKWLSSGKLFCLCDNSSPHKFLSRDNHCACVGLLGAVCGSKRDMIPSVSLDNAIDVEFEHVNVLVTSGPLIPSLVKCLFFRLNNMIACNNVYSSLEVGKLQCFSWIKDRFRGPNVQFCVIGDSLEECEAAQSMRWPFVQIDPQPNSIHRFPGLTSGDLRHYFSVVYQADEDSEKTGGGHDINKSV